MQGMRERLRIVDVALGGARHAAFGDIRHAAGCNEVDVGLRGIPLLSIAALAGVADPVRRRRAETTVVGLRVVLLRRAVVVAPLRVAAGAGPVTCDPGVVAIVRDAVAVAIRSWQPQAQCREILHGAEAEVIGLSEARGNAVLIKGETARLMQRAFPQTEHLTPTSIVAVIIEHAFPAGLKTTVSL
jgi:hypothetical protein